nr:hypothetical protein [Pleurocapsa sp. FMAR1]
MNLVRETSWRGIVDGMVGGYVDAAQMPSGMPLWLTLRGHQDRLSVVSALTIRATVMLSLSTVAFMTKESEV